MTLEELERYIKHRVVENSLVIDNGYLKAAHLNSFIELLSPQRITLEAPLISLEGDMLRVSGRVMERWTIRGLSVETIRELHASFELKRTDGGGEIEAGLSLRAILQVGDAGVEFRGELRDKNTIELKMSDPSGRHFALLPLMTFGGLTHLSDSLTPGIPYFDSVNLNRFDLSFSPDKRASTNIIVTAGLNRELKIIEGALELKEAAVESSIRLQPGRGDIASTAVAITITALLRLEKDYRVVVDVDSDANWELEIIPNDGNLLPPLTELIGIVAGESSELAGIVEESLALVGVKDLSLTGVDVGFNIAEPKLNFISIAARLDALGAKLDANLMIPDFRFGAHLASDSNISVRRVIEYYFGDASGFPDIKISELVLTAQPSTKSYSALIHIEQDWKIPFGDSVLALRDVEFGIERAAQSTSGSVEAVFAIFNLDFSVKADYAHDGGGWEFSGQMIESQGISLNEFFRHLLSAMSLDLPGGLPEIIARNLSASFNIKTQALSLTGEASIEVALPWNDKTLTVNLATSIESLLTEEQRKRTFEGWLQGELSYHKTGFWLKIELGKDSSIRGGLPEGKRLKLSEMVESFLPEAADLPEGLGDISFDSLDFLARQDKSGHVKGAVSGHWDFPFGHARLAIDKAEFNLEKDARGQVKCAIGVKGSGQLDNELRFERFEFTFTHEHNAWSLGGGVTADLFGSRFALDAKYRQEEARKFFRLDFDTTLAPAASQQPKGPQPLLDLPGITSLTVKKLSFEAEVEKEKKTSWEFFSTGDFKLYHMLSPEKESFIEIKDGSLGLLSKNEKMGLKFKADKAKLQFPIYEYEVERDGGRVPRHLGITAGLDYIEIARDERKQWSLEAKTSLEFQDIPEPVDRIFADTITGTLSINGQRAQISISRLTKPLPFKFPEIPTHDRPINLGEGVADLRDITLSLGKEEFKVNGDIVIGLPSNLNSIFGVDHLDRPKLSVLRTYAAGGTDQQKEESLIRLEFEIGTKGVGGKLKNSPLLGVNVTDGKLIIDLCKEEDRNTDKDYGSIKMELPEFKLDLERGSFKARGGLEIDKQRGLKLPLSPVKELFNLFNLGQFAHAIPGSIPVTELDFFDEETMRLKADSFLKFFSDAGIELPNEVCEALSDFAHAADRLPDRFKHYLNFKLPNKLDFNIDVIPDGGVRFNVQTGKERPLKLLLPQIPQVIGLEIRGISFGEVMSGTLFTLDVDARIDAFDIFTLAATMLVPFDQLSEYLPKSTLIHQTLIIDELFMLIIYQTGIPIPLPIFYKELGISKTDITGAEVESHFHFPRPVFDVMEAKTLLAELIKFFKYINVDNDEYLIKLEKLPRSMNFIFTVGPNYIRLPRFLGTVDEGDGRGGTVKKGKLLGVEQGLPPINGLELLAVMMNTAKKRSINYLIQQTRLEKRLGTHTIKPFNLIELDVAWALTTPAEFADHAHQVLADKYEALFKQKHPGKELPVQQSTAELMQMLPATSALDKEDAQGITSKDEGMVVFLRGVIDIGGQVYLDSAFGLVATGASGFGTGLAFRGEVGDLLEVNLWGVIKIMPRSDTERFRLAGHSSFKLLGRQILLGEFSVSDQAFQLRGKVDLFPEDLMRNFPLRVYSGKRKSEVRTEQDTYITGYFDCEQFCFQGGMNLELGVIHLGGYLYIRAGRWEEAGKGITRLNELRLDLYLLDATLVFAFRQEGDDLKLLGNGTPVNLLNGLLKITGHSPNGGPTAYLEVSGGQFKEFYLTGNASLLGVSNSDLMIAATGSSFKFSLNHSFSLSGLQSSLDLRCDLVPADGLTGSSDFKLNLDFGQILKDLIYAITKLPFPKLNLNIGCDVEVRVLAEREIKDTPQDIELARARQDDLFARKRKLGEQVGLIIDQMTKLRRQSGEKRRAAEREVNVAREEIARRRKEIEELKAEIAVLQKLIEDDPKNSKLDEYLEKITRWSDRVNQFGSEIENFKDVLSAQKRRFQDELNRIFDRQEAIREAKQEAESARLYDKLEELEREELLLQEEKELYDDKIAGLDDVRISPRPDSPLERLVEAQKQAEERKSAAQREGGQAGERVLDVLDQRLKAMRAVFEADASADRVLEATAAYSGEVRYASAPSPRESRFTLTIQADFLFLGLNLELPEIRFVLTGIDKINWDAYGVLVQLPSLVFDEIRKNIVPIITAAFENFKALFLHLVRIVFDSDYRNRCLYGEAVRTRAMYVEESAYSEPLVVASASASEARYSLVGYENLDGDEEAGLLDNLSRIEQEITRSINENTSISEEQAAVMLLRSGWEKGELDNLMPAQI